jgi:2-iminobutanoate/2-iminopropanoate deaminase
MSKQAVQTPHAPAAIGAYSQAVVSRGVVYCSGQIALDPATGEVIEGDVAAQTERVMENLSEVLQAAGSSLAAALRCTIFLADMGDFAAVNEVYARFFEGTVPPSRACVAVRSLPKGVDVEIDCIAEVPG